MAFISAIETWATSQDHQRRAAGREERRIAKFRARTYADGIGSDVAGISCGLPNTSFSRTSADRETAS